MPKRVKISGETTVLLTQKEAADFLGVTERTMRNYIRRGLIPAVTIRRRVYLWDRNLLQFLRGARSTRNTKPVSPVKYECADFDAPPDEWVE